MSISVIDAKTYAVLHRFERTQRITVCTNGSQEDLPKELTAVADAVYTQADLDLRFDPLPTGADQVIWWLRGDQWKEGAVRQVLSQLLRPATTFLVPIHLPAMTDLDLIGLQPRWGSSGTPRQFFLDGLSRLRAAVPASVEQAAPIIEELRAADLAPTRISAALYQESLQPGSGIEELKREAVRTGSAPLFRALSLRNAVVALARAQRLAEAQRVLQAGCEMFPDCAELHFLGALLDIYDGRSFDAVPKLVKATSLPTGAYIGSGGENSYRAHWLLAEMASRVGKQGVAVHHAMTGIRHQPAFEPSLAVLLKQRISTRTLSELQWELAGLARREPKYFKPIFDYFLLHRVVPAAERMLRTSTLGEAELDSYQERLASVTQARSRQENPDHPRCLLQGAFFIHSSAALINRKLGAALVQSPSLFGALDPFGYGLEPSASFPEHTALHEGIYRITMRPDLTVRNLWPHDFTRPEYGRLATIVPWEFTGVPEGWVRGMQQTVDEVWVPSQFTRDSFVEAGVDPGRIQVIPNGVDTSNFCPEGPRFRPEGARSFVFLFVGGLILRKGADVLVRAYRRAFRAGDDVTLVLKDVGSLNFYRHMTLLPEIEEVASRANEPHILLIKDDRVEAGLAALYRGSDAFVLPYRGEGFGFPIAEALACGTPVITTGDGPAIEFCRPGESCLIPARPATVPRDLWPSQSLTAPLGWFEPDEEAIAQSMREVYEHHTTWRERAQPASQRIRATHDWEAITARYLERIQVLTGCKTESIAH